MTASHPSTKEEPQCNTEPYCTCEINSVEIVEVVHVRLVRGLGTLADKVRYVQQWWTKEGRLIAENDPFDCMFDARATKRVDTP